MKLIIDIPENLYKATVNGLDANEIWDLRLSVKNGTPLDKISTISIGVDGKAVQIYPNNDVLDKIKAEILEEKECAYADFGKYKVDYLEVDSRYVEDELPYDDFRYGMERCIEIIDRYRNEVNL